MPELPEVETIRRRLSELTVGKTIASVEVRKIKSFQGDPRQLERAKVIGISRKSKILQFDLKPLVGEHSKDSCYLHLLVHLKMTGQLIYDDGQQRVGGGHPTSDFFNSLPSKHTRVVIAFDDETKLFFNDMRIFGWLRLVTSEQLAAEYVGLARDVNDPAFNPLDFVQALEKRSVPIKQVIMDNSVVAGVGNIYASDALHLAQIDPRRPARSLSKSEALLLFDAMHTVITLGIEHGGATISNYLNTDGLSGKYQDIRRVYKREGELCLACGAEIQKIKLAGRGTFFCPQCQK